MSKCSCGCAKGECECKPGCKCGCNHTEGGADWAQKSFEKAWEVMKAINPDWMDYYNVLGTIREMGVTNMFGAAPYLAQIAGIDERLAREVHLSWMENYSEIIEHPDYNYGE